ncbi:MAG: ISAs1 family transposase [Pseudonocardia sp.]|nr:ISAs1 family transposase [Pseudonocardia sp.]
MLAIAVDGKTVRGAIDAEGHQTHLLAAATHGQQLVLGQVEIGAKTNEIPTFAPLLGQLAATGIDLRNVVITADALHTQREHATYLHSIGAHFVFTVKHNQPKLFAALDALPWADTPITHRDVDKSHAPDHHPHHPTPTHPTRSAVPARQPGLADRTPHPRPHRDTPVRDRRARGHQPARPPHHTPRHRRFRPHPLGHRSAALATRHRLPRRPQHRPHPIRTPGHGRLPYSLNLIFACW